jgi:hypothetical protein
MAIHMHSSLSFSTFLSENHDTVELIFLLNQIPVKDGVNGCDLFFCYLSLNELTNPMPIQPTKILCFNYAGINGPHELVSFVYSIHCNLRNHKEIL